MSVVPTNGQYNEHCLPLRHVRRITVCSLLPSELDPPPEITVFEGDGTLRGSLRALRSALRDRDYEVVHAHAAVGGALLLLANAVDRRSMAGSVYTMQNTYANYRLRNRLLLYPVFALFPHVVVCSEAVREALPRSLRRLARRKLAVVANGVDVERVDRALGAAAADRGHDPFTVVSVGRLIEIKNPHTLLDAFADGAGGDGRLVLVGEGDLRGSLESRVAGLGLAGRVELTGLVARDEVYRRVAQADLAVSVSRGEGLPVAVLEAMACGCPVVLSDIQPHREIARGADFIPLLDPDDRAGFAREIERFRRMTSEERRAIGRRCRELVHSRFSIADMHATLSTVYDVARLPGPGLRRAS
jgi:glycosyltransferase involved in cell wall biosynthesis